MWPDSIDPSRPPSVVCCAICRALPGRPANSAGLKIDPGGGIYQCHRPSGQASPLFRAGARRSRVREIRSVFRGSESASLVIADRFIQRWSICTDRPGMGSSWPFVPIPSGIRSRVSSTPGGRNGGLCGSDLSSRTTTDGVAVSLAYLFGFTDLRHICFPRPSDDLREHVATSAVSSSQGNAGRASGSVAMPCRAAKSDCASSIGCRSRGESPLAASSSSSFISSGTLRFPGILMRRRHNVCWERSNRMRYRPGLCRENPI